MTMSKIGSGSIFRDCGTNKGVDNRGDGIFGYAKPNVKKFAKKVARRKRRQFAKGELI